MLSVAENKVGDDTDESVQMGVCGYIEQCDTVGAKRIHPHTCTHMEVNKRHCSQMLESNAIPLSNAVSRAIAVHPSTRSRLCFLASWLPGFLASYYLLIGD